MADSYNQEFHDVFGASQDDRCTHYIYVDEKYIRCELAWTHDNKHCGGGWAWSEETPPSRDF